MRKGSVCLGGQAELSLAFADLSGGSSEPNLCHGPTPVRPSAFVDVVLDRSVELCEVVTVVVVVSMMPTAVPLGSELDTVCDGSDEEV